MDKINLTGFRWAPGFAQGLIRDLRVRWALEEAGLAYEVSHVDLADRGSQANRVRHPFGMVPAFEADGRSFFESGAMVHRIAEECDVLMPTDRDGRSDTLVWMFAALNTVEPALAELLALDFQYADQPWSKPRRPMVEELAKARLTVLETWLAGRDHLLGRFTAADIMMITSLRFARHTDLFAAFPTVAAYVARCEARPAFRRALDAQMADYARNEPVAA
jgi:glutathione S-transferase